MLSFAEAVEEDTYPAVCAEVSDDFDPTNGWDIDIFPEVELRPELRFFAGRPPDVSLRCRGGRVLAVHRAVLTEVSYFDALFNGGFCECGADGLNVDEEPDVLFEVMRWIYCQDAAVDKDIALEVLRLAEFYSIDGLVDHCARVLAALDAGRESGNEQGAPSSAGRLSACPTAASVADAVDFAGVLGVSAEASSIGHRRVEGQLCTDADKSTREKFVDPSNATQPSGFPEGSTALETADNSAGTTEPLGSDWDAEQRLPSKQKDV